MTKNDQQLEMFSYKLLFIKIINVNISGVILLIGCAFLLVYSECGVNSMCMFKMRETTGLMYIFTFTHLTLNIFDLTQNKTHSKKIACVKISFK